MFIYIWEYRVRPERADEFLSLYGAGGAWEALFRRASGYVSTRLLQDRDVPNRFVTVDVWETAEAHASFRRQFETEFLALDVRGEGLTESETHLGDFDGPGERSIDPIGFEYSSASRALQDRFDTRRLADRLVEVTVHGRFTESDRTFIESRDMFFLATVDERGQPTCSYKGGDPGFVAVLDDVTLAFPNYDGNGMYLSMGNIGATGRVGLLFLDLEGQRRMRVDGTAEIATEHPLLDRYPEAQFLTIVRASAIFPNCPRYIHKYELVERSRFVPRPDSVTPTPDWKRTEWARDVLATGDPAVE